MYAENYSIWILEDFHVSRSHPESWPHIRIPHVQCVCVCAYTHTHAPTLPAMCTVMVIQYYCVHSFGDMRRGGGANQIPRFWSILHQKL